jgi:hypothetical protein
VSVSAGGASPTATARRDARSSTGGLSAFDPTPHVLVRSRRATPAAECVDAIRAVEWATVTRAVEWATVTRAVEWATVTRAVEWATVTRAVEWATVIRAVEWATTTRDGYTGRGCVDDPASSDPRVSRPGATAGPGGESRTCVDCSSFVAPERERRSPIGVRTADPAPDAR